MVFYTQMFLKKKAKCQVEDTGNSSPCKKTESHPICPPKPFLQLISLVVLMIFLIMMVFTQILPAIFLVAAKINEDQRGSLDEKGNDISLPIKYFR